MHSPFARFARLEPRLAELRDDLLLHAQLDAAAGSFESELRQRS